MRTISTRNTFRAVVESIPLQLDRLERLETPTAIAVASMILDDADRIIATLEQGAEDAPEWLERETAHTGWSAIATRVDKLREDFSGKTLQDLAAGTRAAERALKRLTTTPARAQATIDRNNAAMAALAALESNAPKTPRKR